MKNQLGDEEGNSAALLSTSRSEFPLERALLDLSHAAKEITSSWVETHTAQYHSLWVLAFTGQHRNNPKPLGDKDRHTGAPAHPTPEAKHPA